MQIGRLNAELLRSAEMLATANERSLCQIASHVSRSVRITIGAHRCGLLEAELLTVRPVELEYAFEFLPAKSRGARKPTDKLVEARSEEFASQQRRLYTVNIELETRFVRRTPLWLHAALSSSRAYPRTL